MLDKNNYSTNGLTEVIRQMIANQSDPFVRNDGLILSYRQSKGTHNLTISRKGEYPNTLEYNAVLVSLISINGGNANVDITSERKPGRKSRVIYHAYTFSWPTAYTKSMFGGA